MVVEMFVMAGVMFVPPLLPLVMIVARTVYCPTTSGRKKIRFVGPASWRYGFGVPLAPPVTRSPVLKIGTLVPNGLVRSTACEPNGILLVVIDQVTPRRLEGAMVALTMASR